MVPDSIWYFLLLLLTSFLDQPEHKKMIQYRLYTFAVMTAGIPSFRFRTWVIMLLSFFPLQFNETIGLPHDGRYGGDGGYGGNFVFVCSIISPSNTDISPTRAR